jgi:ABC-2 type transport system permease protein
MKYLEFFRISFLTILAYRARYYVGIVTYLIYIALNTSVWRAVYAGQETQQTPLSGLNLRELTTFIAVGWICRAFIYNNLDRDIETKVVDGSLAMDMLKPMDFQIMQYSRVLGEGLFRLTLFAGPTALLAFPLFGVSAPVDWTHGLAFFGSLLLGALLFLHINFMIGALAIPLRNLEGISYAKNNLMLFFSGLLIPFAMLPQNIADILRTLPFAGIIDTPLRIYLGQITQAELLPLLAFQLGWCLILFVLARWLWFFMMRQLVIQGG